jgi:hypothetical protein
MFDTARVLLFSQQVRIEAAAAFGYALVTYASRIVPGYRVGC